MTLTAKPDGVQVIEATCLRTGLPLQMFLIPGRDTIALNYEPRRGLDMTRDQARELADALHEWACQEEVAALSDAGRRMG